MRRVHLQSRIRYYAESVPTMLLGFEGQPAIYRLLLRHLRGDHENAGNPVEVVTRSPRMRFYVRNFMEVWTLKETILDELYALFGQRPAPGSTVIDIGAAVGEFTVMAALEYRAGTVVALEPNPESYRLLVKNLQLNGATNVVPLEVAVADSDGEASLDILGDPGSLGISTGASSGRSIKVRTMTLGSVMDAQGLSHCDLLKMDCEGGEYPILESLGPDGFARIGAIVMEYHDVGGRHHSELVDLLNRMGFTVRVTPGLHPHIGYMFASRGGAS